MKTYLADSVSGSFFNNDHLWERSRVDGYTKEDMIHSLTDWDCQYVVTEIDEEVASITSYKDLGDGSCEVHTFVLPKYLKRSEEILKSHIDVFWDEGFMYLYTVCSHRNMDVKNFLIKRLGFTHYDITTSYSHTIDGEPITIYKLMKGI